MSAGTAAGERGYHVIATEPSSAAAALSVGEEEAGEEEAGREEIVVDEEEDFEGRCEECQQDLSTGAAGEHVACSACGNTQVMCTRCVLDGYPPEAAGLRCFGCMESGRASGAHQEWGAVLDCDCRSCNVDDWTCADDLQGACSDERGRR